MPRSQYERYARVPAAFVTTECIRLPSSGLRRSGNGCRPSSFQAPHDPTCTGFPGSETSKMRKSGRPGVVPSGESIASERRLAVKTRARLPACASQISCEPRGSRWTRASSTGWAGRETSTSAKPRQSASEQPWTLTAARSPAYAGVRIARTIVFSVQVPGMRPKVETRRGRRGFASE